MEKVLLPVDLAHADKAEELIAEAVKYAKGRDDVEYTLLHVAAAIPGYVTAALPESFAKMTMQNARTRLEDFAEAHASVLKARTMIRTGPPQHEIIDVAKEIGADLIIIASHKPGKVEYLLGTTASAVVRHAPCSVLVHR